MRLQRQKEAVVQNALKKHYAKLGMDSFAADNQQVEKNKMPWHAIGYWNGMKKKNLSLIVSTVIFSFFLLNSAISSRGAEDYAQVNADNTVTNTRDRSANEVTADDARQNKTDVSLMQKIRHAVIKDQSLSTYAHNIKIVAQNGQITLKGPVNSQDEIHVLVAKARHIAGNDNVRNELSVKNQQ